MVVTIFEGGRFGERMDRAFSPWVLYWPINLGLRPGWYGTRLRRWCWVNLFRLQQAAN